MNKMMSVTEITREFDSEWVLISDPRTAENLEVEKGKVLYHSKDRDEVYRKARELSPKHSAILYTGSLPERTMVVLYDYFF